MPDLTPETLKLSVSGSLPGEQLLAKLIDLQIVLFAAASPEIKQKIADDVGRAIDRLFNINEKLLAHLHLPV